MIVITSNHNDNNKATLLFTVDLGIAVTEFL